MNLFKTIVLLILIYINYGCNSVSNNKKNTNIPFVFQSLDLKHRFPNGNNHWDLFSPNSKYELSTRIIKAKLPQGILYLSNKPAIKITSSIVTILNDGDIMILEGNVIVEKLKGPKMSMNGEKLIWDTKKSTLSFIGKNRYYSWVDSLRNKPLIIMDTQNTFWNHKTGKLHADGPITFNRYNKYDESTQNIYGKRLEGNTTNGLVDIISCMIKQPKERLKANKCTWDWYTDTIIAKKNVFLEQTK